MIEKTTGFKVGQLFFPTLAEAQIEALTKLLTEHYPDAKYPEVWTDIATAISHHSEDYMKVLQQGRELRPRKIRADKGTKRASRKPAPQPKPAEKEGAQ